MLSSSKTLTWLAKRTSPQHLSSRFEKLAYGYGLKSTENLTLPDFLCIGFRKSGTTWLYENLHVHPDIYLPPYKNIRYFSNDYEQPLASYAEHFRPGRGQVTGDFSNNYSFIDSRRIQFIQRVLPQLKLIALLRNPVEREWSELVHNVTEAKKRVEDLSEAEILARLEKSTLLKAGGYNAVLDKWLEYFPEDQLFVGLQDDIKRHPKTAAQQPLHLFRLEHRRRLVDFSLRVHHLATGQPRIPARGLRPLARRRGGELHVCCGRHSRGVQGVFDRQAPAGTATLDRALRQPGRTLAGKGGRKRSACQSHKRGSVTPR